MAVRIAISIGDINGIGPEVVLKTLSNSDLTKVTPIVLSNKKVVSYYAERSDISLPFHPISTAEEIKDAVINIFDPHEGTEPSIEPGKINNQSGSYAMQAVEKGTALCLNQQADALVTAPISKEAVNLAGYNIPGHTEFLAEQTDCSDFMMMLVHKELRVGLVTIHEPLHRVAKMITRDSLQHTIKIMHKSLLQDFQISEPHIAVLGLNPHAGDGGFIGTEEIDIIEPTLKQIRDQGVKVSEPLSADAFFGTKKYKEYNGIVAMYHDQGLIPFKTLSFGSGVNFTAGLPIIRTSPDHGTAFDIAGENIADASSFTQAFMLAQTLAEYRQL